MSQGTSKPFNWEVRVAKAGHKAFDVSVICFTDPARPHLQTNEDEYGCVSFSVARKKGLWRVRQRWPVLSVRRHETAEELEKVVEAHSEHALARVTTILNSYIAALRLGYGRHT